MKISNLCHYNEDATAALGVDSVGVDPESKEWIEPLSGGTGRFDVNSFAPAAQVMGSVAGHVLPDKIYDENGTVVKSTEEVVWDPIQRVRDGQW